MHWFDYYDKSSFDFVENENRDEVEYGDIFYLKYLGQNVFLSVAKTSKTMACVYELAKKKLKRNGKTIEVISGREPAKNPIVIQKKNCERKTDTWFFTDISENGKKVLCIKIGLFVGEAVFLEEELKNGFKNYYFEVEEKKKSVEPKTDNTEGLVC